MVKDNLADKSSNTSDAIRDLLENIEKGEQPPFSWKLTEIYTYLKYETK